MIVRFDTPDLAEKRLTELKEKLKKDKLCREWHYYDHTNAYRPKDSPQLLAYFKEFFICYTLVGDSLEVKVNCNAEELQSVMKMQSLMMEV